MQDIEIPLVVDVDGSLLKSDLLLETLWAALGNHFFLTLWAVLTSVWTPAKLKRALYDLADLDISLQPVDPEVLALCREAKLAKRRVVLASGSDQNLIAALALHLGIAGEHYGSDGHTNLTGRRKAARLVDQFGEYGFDYIGNAAPDLKIWKVAHSIIAVAPSASLRRKIDKIGRAAKIIGKSWNPTSLIKGMRPYQWVKNGLLLVPVLAAHNMEVSIWLQILVGIVSFNAGASTIYIVNDLLDLEADRLHPRKKNRPFASGGVPIWAGMGASVALTFVAFFAGAFIGWEFVGIVALYIATSLAYSFRLKRVRWIDIFMLAWLYTVRVLAGSLAAGIPPSGWLILFVFAAFLSLGAVKRLTELAKASHEGKLPGRGYSRADMGDLFNISIMAVFAAVAIFLAYTFSPTATELYTNQWALRLTSIPIAAWLFRMVLLARDGKQDYDPIVFASRDLIGIALVVTAAALMVVSA